MSEKFPRTMTRGISLPRMIIGCNWISGLSHRSAAGAKCIVRTGETSSYANVILVGGVNF